VARTYYDSLDRPYLAIQNLTAQSYTLDTPPSSAAFGNDQNVVRQTTYDAQSRPIATSEWWLEAGQVVSRTNRTYYDALGRSVHSVRNFVGNLADPTPPPFDPAYPDRNLRSDAIFASDGRTIASVAWLDDATGQVYTRTTRVYYDALGRSELTVVNLDPAWGYAPPTPPACNRDTTGTGSVGNICAEITYNAQGQVVAKTDPLGKTIAFQYTDVMGSQGGENLSCGQILRSGGLLQQRS